MKQFITGNEAVAEAVRLCRPQFLAAYPITPQTPIYEKLSDMEDNGELTGIMMRMESEHSAMAACLAASMAGARTFTATSSQGIALMHEMLHFASGSRAPVVMACVNRSLAIPWGFWSDQTDSLAQRDTGWIQIYCENNQETLDSVIQAFRIAEHVLLPCMVSLEANFISHFMEPIEVPEQEEVDCFLPPVDLPRRFDVDRPGYVLPVVNQDQFFDFKMLTQEAMDLSLKVIDDVQREFARTFGRSYELVEADFQDVTDLILVTAGSITSTARVALTRLREKGHKIGLAKIRCFRPFPTEKLHEVLKGASRIAVIDRNISLGREGIFCSELKAALCNSPRQYQVQGYLAGLGGSDVGVELIESIVLDALNREHFQEQPIWMREK